jgi:hypothetical protein
MKMISYNNEQNGPVMSAAKKALETGKAHHILIWIPEASENTLKNLLEKACCERRIQMDGHNHIIDWYFATVRRFHFVCYGPRNLNISIKRPEEKTIISLVEKACESGNFEEIATVIPDTPAGEPRQRFNDVMTKRNYGVENIAAGRVYVSASTDFIAFVNRLRSGSI